MPAAPTTSPVTAPNRRRASRAPASATSAPRASAPAPRRFAARIDAATAMAATAAVIRGPAATRGPAREPAAACGEVAMVTTMAVRPANGTATRKPQWCWEARRAMNDQREGEQAPPARGPASRPHREDGEERQRVPHLPDPHLVEGRHVPQDGSRGDDDRHREEASRAFAEAHLEVEQGLEPEVVEGGT